MKRLTTVYLVICIVCLAAGAGTPALAAGTPGGQDKLRLHTSYPKKAVDSLFSFTVEWRVDKGELYRVYALTFLNGKKFDGPDSGTLVTKKLVTAMKDGLIQLDPSWRGVNIEQSQEQSAFTILNKAGYSLTNVTVRDYSNQALRYDMVDKSFSQAGVEVALDLVYSADVEYIDDMTTRTAYTASKGEIIVSIDNEKPVHINTDGKTTAELEAELAEHFGSAHLSKTALFPAQANSDTRNIKPFDDSEVQFLNLDAKSIKIDITDPELGIIAKFKYPDNNGALNLFGPRTFIGLLPAIGLSIVGFLWYRSRKRT
ncbi:MAG: hypothetical protein ABSB19_02720 [Methylomonas sp.]|jgi:hypothetical protein